jgi:hypothetical protein
MHGLDLPLFLSLRLDSKNPKARKVGPIRGMRNLFRPTADQKFSANGLVALAVDGNDEPLRQLMKKLALRMRVQESWPDILAFDQSNLPSDHSVEGFENPSIPSGYTYLLQLIAHDIVNSAVSLAGAGVDGFGFANTRTVPLSLETIYGGGPSVCPQTYELDKRVRRDPGTMLRSRLRTGRGRNSDGFTVDCAIQDIARAIPADTNDSGLGTCERLDLSTAGRHPWRTEALLADQRNDDHAILSQLALLFHTLHNHLLCRIASPFSPPADVLREFICTRFAMTLIYRTIITKDVLRRLLHPAVYRRYVIEKRPLLEDNPKFAPRIDGIPVEFSHGAYRCGHTMVRTLYRINSNEQQELIRALEQSSLRDASSLPISAKWQVNWSLFFAVGNGNHVNLSRRIGPSFSPPLLNTSTFPHLSDQDDNGLANRDLLSAACAGLWSVPSLYKQVRSLLDDSSFLPEYETWLQPLREWLGRPSALMPNMSNAEIDNIANDPPLPFFVLFEAAHLLAGGVPTTTGGGRYLGPIGSIIVAETVLGALKENRIGFEQAGDTLKAQVRAVCRAVLDCEAAFDAVPEIENMADLLRFLATSGAISMPVLS